MAEEKSSESKKVASAANNGLVFSRTEQLQHPHCIHSHPSWDEATLLAFQHYIVMLGTIVMISTDLVPRMGGDNGDKARVIQTLLFMSGVNTLLQTFFGTRLPTVMNASFAFLVPVLTIIDDFALRPFTTEHERFTHTMRAIQGAFIASSFLNIIIGYSKIWGRYSSFLTHVVISPMVTVLGLGRSRRGFPQVGNCVEIGLPMLILLVASRQCLKNTHWRLVLQRFSLLFCIMIIWSFAAVLTAGGAYNNVSEETKVNCRTDRSHLTSSAPWIRIPYPFQWGVPIFSVSHAFGMMGAVLVSASESTGAYFAAERLSDAILCSDRISRSVGLQGVGLLLEGIFGAAVGSTVSVENVGLLGLTSVCSRRAVQISTVFMIFFSIFGKFGAFFASIPFPIFAAIYCVLFGLVSAAGPSLIRRENRSPMSDLYIMGLSLFLGISVPEYFRDFSASASHGPVKTKAGWVNGIVNATFSSPLTVSLTVGTVGTVLYKIPSHSSRIPTPSPTPRTSTPSHSSRTSTPSHSSRNLSSSRRCPCPCPCHISNPPCPCPCPCPCHSSNPSSPCPCPCPCPCHSSNPPSPCPCPCPCHSSNTPCPCPCPCPIPPCSSDCMDGVDCEVAHGQDIRCQSEGSRPPFLVYFPVEE